MAVIANDSFTDANGTALASHVSDSGHGWTLGAGSATTTIQSNAVASAGSRTWYLSGYSPSSADYDVTLTVTGTGGSYHGGPAGRMGASDRTYYAINWENTNWRLIKWVAGVYTSLASSYSGDSPVGASVTVRLSMTGSTIKAFIAGVERYSVTDTGISATGRPGLETGDTSGTYDTWQVEAAAGPTITTQPTNQRKSVGQTATFTASATGATSQRWQSNASGSWADISGETSTTYTTGTLGAGVKYAVRIIFSDGTIESTSDPADVWTPSVESLASSVTRKSTSITRARLLVPSSVAALKILEDVFFVTPSAGGSTGTLARTNANDTLSAVATTTIVSTLSRTNASDTVVSSGTTTIVATLARTNANDTLAASGSAGLSISGTVNYTNVNDTSTGQATTTIVSSLARTNANDTSSASGSPVANGTLARTNNNDTVVATSTTTIVGTLSYTNNNDSVSASGSAGLAATGSVNYTNRSDTSSGSGTTTIIATVSRSNNNDTLSAAGSTGTGGSGNSTKLPLTGAGAT